MQKQEIKDKEIKDLGTVNGWKKCPEEYMKCQVEANHITAHRNIGICHNEYTCKICGIKWRIDSSD